MDQLVEFFRNYFPKSFDGYPIKRIDLSIVDNKVNLDVSSNSINIFNIKLSGRSNIIMSLNDLKKSLIYLDLEVIEGSEASFIVYGKVSSDIYLGISSSLSKESKLSIEEKLYIEGKMVNIAKIIIPKGSVGSYAVLDQKIVSYGESLFINLPILIIKEPKCKAELLSKKIRLDEDQLFYLKSKGMSDDGIKKVLERYFTTL